MKKAYKPVYSFKYFQMSVSSTSNNSSSHRLYAHPQIDILSQWEFHLVWIQPLLPHSSSSEHSLLHLEPMKRKIRAGHHKYISDPAP